MRKMEIYALFVLSFLDSHVKGAPRPPETDVLQKPNLWQEFKTNRGQIMDEGATPFVYLTRVEKFSACHRLHSVKLTDEENESIYGKCNNPNGHGHNYTLETTVKGPVDAKTGMVMNITDLKNIIDMVVMTTMDHKHLDKDVPAFRDFKLVTTTENVAVIIFKGISQCLPPGVQLHQIKLHETDKNIVTFKGEFN